jgi:hypothetical protein
MGLRAMRHRPSTGRARRGRQFSRPGSGLRGARRAPGKTDEEHERSVFIMGRVCHLCPRTVLLPMSPTVQWGVYRPLIDLNSPSARTKHAANPQQPF